MDKFNIFAPFKCEPTYLSYVGFLQQFNHKLLLKYQINLLFITV